MDFIAMDYETANRTRASACSIALVVVRDNRVVDSFYSLINPQVRFESQNTRIHGISAAMVADAPTWPQMWPHVQNFFTRSQLVTAHNASFDASVVRKSLERYQLDPVSYQLIDTVKTSRELFPALPNHKLNTMSDFLDIRLDNHHNALADAFACARILLQEATMFGQPALQPFVKLQK
ncbi:3'-5' exonuclease [Lacticaseibacillus saniviri]|uniref:DNA polymerase III polC-type n=1 Tax=Lacticaseibacillus saniviri JCM 17471 = DSM 24301 TaxID=1293598 RepID=A0A0R2MSX2_9LACO|nr:3'-5' exonuclease [Lacticaseibacillus saniviri]KRO16585.1 DNA polymerase III, epsilon subunit related 3-5 exonuclease [Lacticaseibacillus saniviri JCM 17471 = DSM 24301]MCG4282710.1 3'-5' exonuclease [Lacticaseibacillus saniviri]